MKRVILFIFAVLGIFLSWSVSGACDRSDSLFKIERNKNRNVVQYDACLLSDGNLSDSDPISAYWILENGQRENLNTIEKSLAYGIKLKKKLGKDRVEVCIAALSDRGITVEKKDGKYRVIASINGKESVLEKIYVQAEESKIGRPKVLYVELFGKNLSDNSPVRERITPKA